MLYPTDMVKQIIKGNIGKQTSCDIKISKDILTKVNLSLLDKKTGKGLNVLDNRLLSITTVSAEKFEIKKKKEKRYEMKRIV